MPKIIGGIVVVAILVVAIIIVRGGSDSNNSGAVNAKAAHAGLRTVLQGATFDESGTDDLRVCPLGDLDDLYDAVDKAIGLDPAVGEGIDERSAREEGDLPGFVSCQRYAKDESKVDKGATSVFFQAVLDPPGDYEGYIRDFAGDATDITFDDSVRFTGGTVHMFCATASGDPGFTGCDADWVDSTAKIALNVFLGGDNAKPTDAFVALKAVLAIMSKNLAKLASGGGS